MRKRKIPSDTCDSSPSLNKVDDSNTLIQRTTRYMHLGIHTLRRSAFHAPALREPFCGALLFLPAPLSVLLSDLRISFILSYYPRFVNHITVFIFVLIEKYLVNEACILVKLIIPLEICRALCYNSRAPQGSRNQSTPKSKRRKA